MPKKLSLPRLKLPKKYLSFLNTRNVIRAVFIMAFIFLVVCLLYPFIALKKIKLPKITPALISQGMVELKSEVKPFEFYADEIKGKQIFSRVASGEAEKPISGANVDLVKDINLVGIITGDNPQAVIEDKKTQKSYYVTKGQSVGDFQVEEIQEGKIILNYMGQRFELSL